MEKEKRLIIDYGGEDQTLV